MPSHKTTTTDFAPTRPVVVHLSGQRRGTTEYLHGGRLRIGTSEEAEIRLPAAESSPVTPLHASLDRQGGEYEIRVTPGSQVWVNGKEASRRVLESGDVLEIGRDGPILRFRLHPRRRHGHKRMRESVQDCLDCARHEEGGALQRLRTLLAGLSHELATQTSRWFRLAVTVMLLVLIATTGTLAWRSLRLERELESEHSRWSGLEAVVVGNRLDEMTPEDLEQLRTELSSDLTSARERLELLEERAGAGQRIIATAARGVVFLQGAYGFRAEDGRLLRFAVRPDGGPVLDARGAPVATLEGNGPPVERFYTGTAFVASADGLLLTNRHVALPWDFDEGSAAMVEQGLEPVMRRFVGYLPGVEKPFEVVTVGASDTSDLAVLRCSGVTAEIPLLPLADTPLAAGEEVVVLGYPTGIRALLARTDEAFMASLMSAGELDFWQVAELLAVEGRINPLATRGIVGQVSANTVVYDAMTTHGGSGGPVLDLDGRVVAINAAIVPEFGGSNMGVPAAEARRLLAEALADSPAPAEIPPPRLAADDLQGASPEGL